MKDLLLQTVRALFAGKLHAILARRWVKGRDWFDLVWYLTERKGLEPKIDLLEHALQQTKTSAPRRRLADCAITDLRAAIEAWL